MLNYFNPLKFVYAFFVHSIWLVLVNVGDILERSINNGAVWCVFCALYTSLNTEFFTVLFDSLHSHMVSCYLCQLQRRVPCSRPLRLRICLCSLFLNSLTFGFTYFKDMTDYSEL